MYKAPIISVIIVTFNPGPQLSSAIESVIGQNYPNIELIIIDGGSSDGTIEILRGNQKHIAYWISEPDKGIYDAMNKGIDRANGRWLYFLGADDTLEFDVLSQVIPYLTNEYVMVYGDIIFNNGRRVSSFLNSRTLLQNTVHHQGSFYEKRLFVNFRYNSKLRILSDYELNLKIYRQKLPTQRLPIVIARCMEGGASSHLPISLQETNLVRARFIGDGITNKMLSVLLRLYYMQKQIRGMLFK